MAQPNFSFDASDVGDIDGLGSGSEIVNDTSGSIVTHDFSYSYDGIG